MENFCSAPLLCITPRFSGVCNTEYDKVNYRFALQYHKALLSLDVFCCTEVLLHSACGLEKDDPRVDSKYPH